MWVFKPGLAFIAGLAGTVIMTILIYVVPDIGLPELDMISLIGAVFTSNRELATALGLVIHFVLGGIFGVIYAWLWSLGFGHASWLWGSIYGAVHGVIVIYTFPVMVSVHPRAPEQDLEALMMVGVIIGHLVFALVTALIYRGIAVQSEEREGLPT